MLLDNTWGCMVSARLSGCAWHAVHVCMVSAGLSGGAWNVVHGCVTSAGLSGGGDGRSLCKLSVTCGKCCRLDELSVVWVLCVHQSRLGRNGVKISWTVWQHSQHCFLCSICVFNWLQKSSATSILFCWVILVCTCDHRRCIILLIHCIASLLNPKLWYVEETSFPK